MIRQPGKRGPANRSQSLSGKAHHGHDLAWLNRGGSKVVRHTNPRGCPDEIYDSGIPAMSPRHGWTGLVSAGLRALHDSRISPIASSLSIARRGRRRPRTFSARGGEFSSRADHTAAVGGRCRRCRQSARPCRSSKRGPLVVASPLDQSPGDEALGDYMSYEAADEFVEGIPLVRLGRRSRSTGLAGCVDRARRSFRPIGSAVANPAAHDPTSPGPCTICRSGRPRPGAIKKQSGWPLGAHLHGVRTPGRWRSRRRPSDWLVPVAGWSSSCPRDVPEGDES